jgi:hypothetical protein
MKKQLLNSKKQAQLFFSVCLVFLCANFGWSQTIFYEGFGPAAVSPFTAGATAYTTASNPGSNGLISAVDDLNANTYLNFTSSTAAGRPYLTAPLSVMPSPFNPTLTSNTKLVTWSFNMRVSRAMSSGAQTYNDGAYYLAVVLCSSNATLTAGTGSNTDGYALILQRHSSGLVANPGGVRLVKFHNGIGLQTAGSAVSTPLLETVAFNSGAVATAAAPNNVSIKVEYNPDFDSWQMYYREDPVTAPLTFGDPTTGTYTLATTNGLSSGGATVVVDNTYTATAMTHFGFLAGLSTSVAVGNQMQLDNFNISLSTLPAYTAPPAVEKKQAIHNSPAPTVANLVAVGTDVKWYAAATGGAPLLSTDLISSQTYYATQTVAGTESDRIASSIYVGDTTLRTLPLYENFNYAIGDKLVTLNNDAASGTGIGTWSVVSSLTTLSPDDMLIAAQPSPWTSSVLPAPTGNALTFDRSGLDPQLIFAAPTTGSLYASCLFMVTNLNGITTGTSGSSTDVPAAPAHIFSLAYADAAPGSVTSYTAAVYLKSSATVGKFNIGINAAPIDPIAVGDIKWDTADYDVNTPITVVIGYSYDDLISKLYINPTSNAVEPAPNAATLARAGALNFDRIRLNQNSNAATPYITLDEIRVANNWGQALGGSSTLGMAKVDVSKFSAYPNPVTNGKLYISSESSSEKQVAIYTLLGQKVLETKTANNAEINVSQLAKGAYILNVIEDGKSDSKKLMIK